MLRKEQLRNLKKYEYDEIIEKLQNCLKYYENYYARDNKYTIYLANCEKIYFQFHDINIPHLLGVNTTYLSNVLQIKGNDSYSILENFLCNSYNVYNKVKNGVADLSQVFSKYIDVKLGNFYNVIESFNPQDIYFICKYDTSKKYQSDDELSYTSQYYIARKNNDDNIVLLGIDKQEDKYYAQSSRLIEKESIKEELKLLLSKQIVTFANTIKIDNYQNGYKTELYANFDIKRTQITRLVELCNDYGCDAATASDHLFCLKGLISKSGRAITEKELLQELSQNLKNGQVFDVTLFDAEAKNFLSDEVLNIIDACNDFVVQGGSLENQKLYSELQKENLDMLDRINKLNLQKENLEKENNDLKALLEQYKLGNDRLSEFQNSIFEVVDHVKVKK